MTPCNKQFRKRNAILACLRQSTSHPSAEAIFAQLKPEIPDLSIGTVYRNLTLFKKQGLATTVATVRGVERFDGTTESHVHFICSDCDTVIDLTDMAVPAELMATAVRYCCGEVTGCQLSFTGRCRTCMCKEETA